MEKIERYQELKREIKKCGILEALRSFQWQQGHLLAQKSLEELGVITRTAENNTATDSSYIKEGFVESGLRGAEFDKEKKVTNGEGEENYSKN